ncbi:hypothetical protein [Bradyrhizobium forestalis]|uniref:hypothetical protein n=1 Tax=Bradyrhizobium forestalis TaxID=1419263 RepID=UPI0013043BAC|nr:hypothetical protein [Bradyrhizobium forestalis]
MIRALTAILARKAPRHELVEPPASRRSCWRRETLEQSDIDALIREMPKGLRAI